MANYKTEYSNNKNVNTLNQGSYNDFGDSTPAKQTITRQLPGDKFSVEESPIMEAITDQKTISTEVPARVGVSNMTGRNSVLIQPTSGILLFGFTSGKLYHQLSKGNFFEVEIDGNTDVYIKALSGTVTVTISELNR